MAMDVAVTLPQLGHAANRRSIRRAAIQAEELGFSHVWVNDHITFPLGQSHPSPYMYDPLLTLATAAAVTARIGIGGQGTAAYYAPLWLGGGVARPLPPAPRAVDPVRVACGGRGRVGSYAPGGGANAPPSLDSLSDGRLTVAIG